MGALLTAAPGAIYLGTEQFLTLATVIGVLGAILVFLLKTQFTEITSGIRSVQQKQANLKTELNESIEKSNHRLEVQIREYNDKTNERIDKLETKTGEDIANIKKELGDIKGDFSTSFVLREDFFRAMNGVEDSVKNTSRNVDKLLLLMEERKGNWNE